MISEMACTIQIKIEANSGGDQYTTRVLHSPVGAEPSATMQLDAHQLLEKQPYLEAVVLASSVTGRRVADPGEQALQDVGGHLFRALFTGAVLETYRASVAAAQDHNEQLRVELRLGAPELAALPWEALWDQDTKNYVCLTAPLVRHVPAPYTCEPLKVTPPLRILGLVATPRGMSSLAVSTEQQRLEKALEPLTTRGLLHFEWLQQAGWAGVQEKLLSDEWHVLHFIGHGHYDVTNDEGSIAWVDADGGAVPIPATRLACLLSEARPTPRLVVLNSCSSGAESTRDLFSGTAAVLARSGVSAVAAMQFRISDTAATSFAAGFYTAIARNRTVENAVRSGRISIMGAQGTLEWVTPVLYLRGGNSRPFILEPQPEKPVNEQLYAAARTALDDHDYDTVIGKLDQLLVSDPHYRDAAALRRAAAEEQDLAHKYQQAIGAQEGRAWSAAADLYGEILATTPDYRDAAARRRECLEHKSPSTNIRWKRVLMIGTGAAVAALAIAAAISFSTRPPPIHWSDGECARLSRFTDKIEKLPCDSTEADAKINAIVSGPEKCNPDDGTSSVTGWVLCWDVNWRLNTCWDRTETPVKQIPCTTKPDDFLFKVVSINPDTVDGTKCGPREEPSINEIEKFVVCLEPLQALNR
ncbi:CHAT domain-containing protein [Nocardia salmonicida]|uniref:CHAT domain-containing protein n=1 Tax=Nocardia salmonicida TaxID=53431 RepID=UPI0007A435CD|nr:CHAT domain-containing protein [Nocardia salmonicida]